GPSPLGSVGPEVRSAALQALRTLVEKGADVKDMLTPVLNALQDSNYEVRSAALQALEQMPTELLISAYWETKDVDLTLLIVPKLYDVALAVEDISSDQRQLILYPTIGDAIKWTKYKQEIQALGELIFQRFLAMFFEVAEEGHLEIVGYLLAHGANIETRHKGQTLLHFFAQEGNFELVKLLCERGANLEAQDSRCRTAVWIAAHAGHLDIVRHLCGKGASLEARDRNGTIPFLRAVQQVDSRVRNYLLWEPTRRVLRGTP
ncbi:MAG: ankyrin repeat domain-containing protein, partial [Bacteroidota bacterium]